MTLPNQLTTLESCGLILLAQLQPEIEYQFRHALVQEAAYGSLVRIDRRRLHQAVGEALERLYPAEAASPELTPLLARHFAEAGDLPRALRYHTLAGRGAADMYANAEAIHHYGRALDVALALAAPAGAIVDLYLRRGRAFEHNAQDAAALVNYEALESWAMAAGDQPAQLAALTARTTIYVKPSVEVNLARGHELSQQALALARALGDPAAEAKTLWNLLQYYILIGDSQEALARGEQALAIAREHGLREQSAYVLTDLLKVYFQLEQPQRATAALEEAREIWRDLGILNMLADNLGSTSMMLTVSGRYDEALEQSAEAQRVSRQIGNVWNQSYALYLVDMAHFERGDIGQAIAVASECLRLAEQAGFAEGINQSGWDLALIYGYMGALPRALETARQAQARNALLNSSTQPWGEMEALEPLLYIFNDRLDEAQAALERCRLSHDAAQLAQQFILTQLIFHYAQAEVALAQNDPLRALAVLENITRKLKDSGVRLFYADALCLQGRALRAAGQSDEARTVLEAARAEAEDVGARRALWQILAELAALAEARADLPAALALKNQAAEIIDYIAQHAGSDELAASFLNRASVRAVRQHAGPEARA